MVALADAGIAMGGLGSDATIETADIVIQNDQPSKIVTAIEIGKLTRRIVLQNITMAMVSVVCNDEILNNGENPKYYVFSVPM